MSVCNFIGLRHRVRIKKKKKTKKFEQNRSVSSNFFTTYKANPTG